MDAQEYLGRSRLFRRLKVGPHGQVVERYAARLVEDGLVRRGTWRCQTLEMFETDLAGNLADSGDCGRGFRLIADSDSDRSRTAFR
jgi:hypothetical protein